MIEGAKARLNGDARYQATTDIVETNDPLRVYVMRRSHGGRPHYLKAWPAFRKAYDEWLQNPPHPIHIFPGTVAEQITKLEPAE